MRLHFLLFRITLFSLFVLTVPTFAQDNIPGELVLNPGFENAPMGSPADWGGVPFITTISSASQAGQHSLKIESPDAEYAPIATQNIFNFQPEKQYRLRYNARGDKFGVEYRVYLGLWKDAPKDAPAGTPATEWVDGVDANWRQAGTAWQSVTVDFKMPANANRMMVVLQMKGPGAMWFDNVSITPLAPDAAPATPTLAPVAPAVAAPLETIAPNAQRGVQITTDRRFIVDGKPFFPIQIWGWTPYSDEGLQSAREWGFNIVSTPALREYGLQATRAWLDAAQRNGVRAMIATAFVLPPDKAAEWLPLFTKQLEPLMPLTREHPATFGYNINDEPAWAGFDAEAHNRAAQWLKAQDSLHPIFVNHAPRNTIEEIKRYNPYIDISGSDIYPVWREGVDRHSDLPNKTISVIGDETRKNLSAVDGKKPIMQTLQGFSWSDGATGIEKENPHPFPTRQQLRFMAWDSIVAGATGIAWFQDERYRELRPELKPVVREFASLQDVMSAGAMVPTAGSFPAPIQTIAWKWNGKTVLVATNSTAQAVQVQPDWKTVFGGNTAVRALWENRSGGATESFQPFDVHIYTDAPNDADILRAGFDVEPIAP